MKDAHSVYGISTMLAATALFVASDSFTKLTAETLPPFEVLLLRASVAAAGCAVLVALRQEWNVLFRSLHPRALLRAACEAAGTLCYIVALAHMPIADVIAVLQITPLLLIVGAALIFGEKVGLGRSVLSLVGFLGALLIVRPAGGEVSSVALLALASVVLLAGRDLAGRGVPGNVPLTIVNLLTMVLVAVAAGLMTSIFEIVTLPSARAVAYVGLAGLCLALAHLGLLLAYRLASTTAVAPFLYSEALWGVVSGLLIWDELPDTLALSGITLIVASGVTILLLDKRRSQLGRDLID